MEEERIACIFLKLQTNFSKTENLVCILHSYTKSKDISNKEYLGNSNKCASRNNNQVS